MIELPRFELKSVYRLNDPLRSQLCFRFREPIRAPFPLAFIEGTSA
jgi:hypothetical protein